jgi:uncharacterized protein (DUF1810 family)
VSQSHFNLERFVAAQNAGGTYDRAVRELRNGRKTSHWMWFIFPQVTGLGSSQMSRTYAIGSLEEARAYLAHPVLGARLKECAQAVSDVHGKTAHEILGDIDAVKLRSSMTLFHRADPTEPVFDQVLHKYFNGTPDPATDERLQL